MENGVSVVDITVTDNNQDAVYNIPEMSAVVKAGNLILATEMTGIINELKVLTSTARDIISNVDKQREIVAKGEHLMQELSPEFRSKAETEARFKGIENTLSELKAMLSGIANSK